MAKPEAILFAGVLVAASCGSAQAVDLPPVPRLPAAGLEAAEFSGWYLRGDVGWGQAEKPDLETAPNPIPLAAAEGFLSPYASQAFNATLSPFGMIDAGAGYQFNDWLRLDATLEYRGAPRLQSRTTLTDLENPVFGGPLQLAGSYRAHVASAVGLINGYASLPAFWGISPFSGAGIGFADNSLSGVTGRGFADARSGLLALSGGAFSNASKTSLAWALMAGLDVSVAPNLKLEASYRYLRYGEIAAGGSHCLAPAAGAAYADGCIGGLAYGVRSNPGLAFSDFRIGLIWLLGEPAPSASAF